MKCERCDAPAEFHGLCRPCLDAPMSEAERAEHERLTGGRDASLPSRPAIETAHLLSVRVEGSNLPHRYRELRPAEEPPRSGRCLVIRGSRGVGKTWRAASLLLRQLASGPGLWLLWPVFLAQCRASFGDRETADPLYSAIESRFLVIDDLASERRATEWSRDAAYALIQARYAYLRTTIITSRLSDAELRAYLGEDSISRLAEWGDFIELQGPDRRLQHA